MNAEVVERVGALPTTSDVGKWDEREQALAMQLGLAVTRRNGTVDIADRGTIEAFLTHCRRTNLDPIARQIYIIKRGNKWQTQISIDGARLVAERSGDYAGQTPVEWTADGVTWTQVWLAEEPPRAARAGVYRKGFEAPLYAVARWDSYAVYQDEWVNGSKTGKQVVSSMWAKMPDLMLGKVAEMLALRKAFPMDLSGLYSTEEMQQADSGRVPAPQRASEVAAAEPEPEPEPAPASDGPAATDEPVDAEVVEEPGKPEFDAGEWALRIQQCTTVDQLRAVWDEASAAGVLGAPFDNEGNRLGDAIQAFKPRLEMGR